MNLGNHSFGLMLLHRRSSLETPCIKISDSHAVFSWLVNRIAQIIVFKSCKVLDIVQT